MTVKRMTKSELIRQLDIANDVASSRAREIVLLSDEIKQYRECRAAFGVIEPEAKEPETEVGYLRRQLAYAQGQLHQSHLTVKALAARINMVADHHGPSYVEPKPVLLSESDRLAIDSLLSEVRAIKADMVNSRDLGEAGIMWTDAQHARVVEVFENQLGKMARGVERNTGHGDEGPFTSTA